MSALFRLYFKTHVLVICIACLMIYVLFPFCAQAKDFEIPLKELKSSSGKDFEIPLNDLTKKEKKKSRRQEYNSRKENKNSDLKEMVTPPVTTEPAKEVPASTIKTTEQPAQTFQIQAAPNKVKEENKEVSVINEALPDEFQIIHEPYSFVVSNKRTVINAVVIATQNAIQLVRCRFRASDKGGFAQIQMKKIPGSNYTYTATLPPLTRNTGTLRYAIMATDSLKREIKSREFATPVKMTLVIPGWQTDEPKEKIKVQLENPNHPFEGFADISVEETKPSKTMP